jgi:hypothetical protein
MFSHSQKINSPVFSSAFACAVPLVSGADSLAVKNLIIFAPSLMGAAANLC